MKEGYQVVEVLEIPSSFGSLTMVEALVDKVCNKLNVREDYYGNVLIAVTEAVNNAIQHGNKENDRLKVIVKVGENSHDFCFAIKDFGQGFDPTSLVDPTAPENIEKEDGRGIFLMKSLAEAVEFSENGTLVNIYFSKN